MNRLTTKRTVFVVALVAVLLLLLASSRTWVHGTLADPVLSSSRVTVSGSKAAPGMLAAALVGAAAVIAALTSGRVLRWVAAAIVPLAGVLAAVATFVVVGDPAGPVADRAASTTGRTGGVAATGHLTAWPWVAVLAAVLLVLAGLLCLLGVRRWAGLSGAYDAPTAKPERKVSDWDRLSDGEDPTADDHNQS